MLMNGLKTTIAFLANSAINMACIEITNMTEAEVDDACKIEQACFSIPFKRDDLLRYLNDPYWHFLVAKADGAVVGYLSYMVIFDEATLVNVAVLPEFRGKKIGKALLQSLITDAKSRKLSIICLEVRESNQTAIGLYTKFGFMVAGVSKNHYSAPVENALRMNLTL